MNFENIKSVIERVFDNNEDVNPNTSGEVRDAIESALKNLDSGKLSFAALDSNSALKFLPLPTREKGGESVFAVAITNIVSYLSFVKVSCKHIFLVYKMFCFYSAYIWHINHGIHFKIRQFKVSKHISLFHLWNTFPFVLHNPWHYCYIF